MFKEQTVIVLLCCEIEREMFSEVTAGFNDKFTAPPEPMLLDFTGSNYCFARCLLPLPGLAEKITHISLLPTVVNRKCLYNPQL